MSVVGPSGCGKSTLMLMVAGLLKRSRGDIVIGGKPVTKPITDVGIAFQDHLLLDFRTALDNVMLHADIRKLPKQADRGAREGAVRAAAADAAMDKYPRQLSGGMRQRVSLIRTLVHDPSLLLMDEPFGALDALTRLQVRTDLEALRRIHLPGRIGAQLRTDLLGAGRGRTLSGGLQRSVEHQQQDTTGDGKTERHHHRGGQRRASPHARMHRVEPADDQNLPVCAQGRHVIAAPRCLQTNHSVRRYARHRGPPTL